MRVAKDALLFGDGRKGERGGGTGGIEVQEDVDEGEAIGDRVAADDRARVDLGGSHGIERRKRRR